MKKFLLALPALVALLAFGGALNAQNTDDGVFALDVTIDGVTTTLKKGIDCGFETSSGWGGPVLANQCWEAAWQRSAAGDTLGCSAAANDLTGKIALSRRGTCNFTVKCQNAQDAGAGASIVFNHYTDGTQNNCTVIPMGGTTTTVTIPSFFLSRDASEWISAAINQGKTVTICTRLLSLYDPTAEYSYAIPVSQVDSLNLITVNAVNRTGIEQEFNFKATITDPQNNQTVLEYAETLGIDSSTLASFPLYKPSAGVGTYTIMYTADKAVAAGDTVYRSFEVTPYSYASDNLSLRAGGVGPVASDFITANFKYQTASMVKTGPAGMTAKYATFGIGNASAVGTDNPAADLVNVLLYDADANDDNSNDLSSNFSDMQFIAFGEANFSKNTPVDSLLNIELTSVIGDNVELEPNHLYYISILYDRVPAIEAGFDSTAMRFSFTNQVYYGQFTFDNGTRIGLATPLQLGTLYSGWSGATVVTRLHEEGYEPVSSIKTNLLAETKVSLTPNPTVDFVNINLDLATENEMVAVTLIDFTGKALDTYVYKNVKQGQYSINTTKLPSGAYTMWIRTSKEGSTMRKLMICH